MFHPFTVRSHSLLTAPLAGLLLASAFLAPARAVVRQVDLNYSQDFLQTGPFTLTLTQTISYPFLYTDTASDLAHASVLLPNNSTRTMTGSPISPSGSGYIHYAVHANRSAMMAAVSSGNYTYSISGGTLGVMSAVLNQPLVGGAWSAQSPQFSAATYTSVSAGVDPDSPLTVNVNIPTGIPGFGVSKSLFILTAGGSPVYNANLSPVQTTIVIPAGTLDPDASYRLGLQFRNAQYNANAHLFGTASSTISFIEATSINFTTGQPQAACDSIDFNNDGVSPDSADLADFLAVFGGGACSTGMCNDIDFDNDGVSPDSTDIDTLLRVFGGGSCV